VNDWLFAIQCEIAFNLEDILSRDIFEERKALEHKEKWWKKSLETDVAETSEGKTRNPLSKSAAITEVYVRTDYLCQLNVRSRAKEEGFRVRVRVWGIGAGKGWGRARFWVRVR